MNITVTGRHLNTSDSLKDYAEKKFSKLEKYFNQLIDAHLIFYVEKQDHGCEAVINGDGIQFHGREKAADLYSAVDLLWDKMEKQIVRYKERHQTHKGPEKSTGAVPDSMFDYSVGEGRSVALSQVSNKPIDKIEAFLQMKIQKRDFILFKLGDENTIESEKAFSKKNYAIIYRDGAGLKMVEIPFERIKNGSAEKDMFVEYLMKVHDDSPSDPKIDFTKSSAANIGLMTIDEAVQAIDDRELNYLPFYNTESHYLNIIYKNGKKLEVMVPAF